MVTTSAWVPRGFAAPFPTKYQFDEDEFERIAGLAKLQLDDAKEDLEEAQEEEEEESKKAVGSSKTEGSGSTPAKNTARDEYVMKHLNSGLSPI